MSKVPNSSHPPWCEHGRECAMGAGLHVSSLTRVAPRGDEVIQVAAGLWRMDVGPSQPGGVLLELSVGEGADRWPIDLRQSAVLVPVLHGLIRLAGGDLSQAA